MKKKKVAPNIVPMGKTWTICTNGHTYYYECGVVISPIPVYAECCGAAVIKSGSDPCGEG